MLSGLCGLTNVNSNPGSAISLVILRKNMRIQYYRAESDDLFSEVRKDLKVEDSLEIGFEWRSGIC